MKLIRIKNNNETVAVEIRVTGLVLWRFRYEMDEIRRARKGDDDTIRTIALGAPDKIGSRTNAWIFNVTNPGNRDRKFKLSLRWMQGGKKIASWSGRGTVRAGKTAIRRGESAFVVRKESRS